MEEGKNVVVCCDGTGNSFSEANTNVVHLYQLVEQHSSRQIAYYDPGVGTFSPRSTGNGVLKKAGKVMGAAFGYGVTRNIEDAYRFLMDTFEDHDRVYLLGFSRGAFTARALAGMLHKVGLLYPKNDNLISYASKKYNEQGNDAIAAEFKRSFCRECRPHFIGVWDTVGSLGTLLSMRKFYNTRLNPDVTHAFQALAIDERRSKFPPSLWNEKELEDHQEMEQVWFAGVHSDVGGGYADDQGLAAIALKWLLGKAEERGLRMDTGKNAQFTEDVNGKMHHSYSGWWKLLPKSVREIPDGSHIHESVFERMAGGGYDPVNMPSNPMRAS